MDGVSNGKDDVTETEGLRAAFAGTGGVFGGSQEPVEGDDSEIADVPVGDAIGGMLEVEDFPHVAKDGDIGRVGALGG